jgi:hypothetical protein
LEPVADIRRPSAQQVGAPHALLQLLAEAQELLQAKWDSQVLQPPSDVAMDRDYMQPAVAFLLAAWQRPGRREERGNAIVMCPLPPQPSRRVLIWLFERWTVSL